MGKLIFEPVDIGGLKLKNRLVRSATWEGIATRGGGITDVAYEIYDEVAIVANDAPEGQEFDKWEGADGA